MSDKAQAMIDELVAACIEFGRQADPDRLTRLKKARQELHEYIAELEAKVDQLTVHSDIERQDDKSPNDTQPSTEELPEWQQAAEAIKNLSIKFEELPEWQQAALPENYKLAHTVLLAFGLSLANLLIELGVAERISEVEE